MGASIRLMSFNRTFPPSDEKRNGEVAFDGVRDSTCLDRLKSIGIAILFILLILVED